MSEVWTAHEYGSPRGTFYIKSDAGETIASSLRCGAERAHLLAAAPDLLEALKFYADPGSWTEPNQANRDEMFDTPVQADNYGDRARAALAKAGS